MNKQQILEQTKQARERLLKAIDGLTPDQMLRPGVVGLWAVKDILAHVTVWQSELITALARAESQPTQVPEIVRIDDIDEWNMEQYSVNAPRPLDIIVEDFHGVHKHLLKMIEGMSDKMLTDVRSFRWMEGEPLSYLIAEHAFWHEDEHSELIEQWRTAQGL